MDDKTLALIDKLAEGYSNLAKNANRFWIALIIVSITAIFPNSSDNKIIVLPFSLGEVNNSDFYVICLFLICILTIAYASSLLQTTSTRKLIQIEIEKLSQNDRFISNTHIQDYLDAILFPTYYRVAPIIQFIQGKNHFLEKGNNETKKAVIPRLCYIVLKFFSVFLIHGVPTVSFFMCYNNINPNNESVFMISKLYYFAIIILYVSITLVLLLVNIGYSKKVTKRIRSE